MRVGVLSDTHIPSKSKRLPEELTTAFRQVDHIIHLGDIISQSVLDELGALSPVTAVSGNADPEQLQQRLGAKKLINLEGFRVGIVHGHGTSGKTADRAFRAFAGEGVDCILFGHSHIPLCEFREQILMFNPGSPTDKRRNSFYSFGILELDTQIRAMHCFFNRSPKGLLTVKHIW
ncbi:MAG: phosphodiesterase, family [Bacillota bacterium]|nr:phosphodiesterase, family [Bacillota bacterium]